MSWKPSTDWLRAKVTRPFLPHLYCPSISSSLLVDLYPGDDLYIFETRGNKWARAYAVSKPFPRDFPPTTIDFNHLPRSRVSIVIVPLRFVHILHHLPFASDSSIELTELLSLSDSPSSLPLPLPLALPLLTLAVRAIPNLPLQNFDSTGLASEIYNALSLLTCHIYALYLVGEFPLFGKLVTIYNELNETRIKLSHEILTQHETSIAHENATFLLNKIPKKLASRTERKDQHAYDFENASTDVAGYKIILARNMDTGELLNKESPPIIAAAQLCCALEKHSTKNLLQPAQFSLAPATNKWLRQGLPSHILVDYKSVVGIAGTASPSSSRLLVYMYVRNQYKRLTEAFVVYPDSNSFVHMERVGAGLFQNLPYSEIQGNRVFLCAVIVEESPLRPGSRTSLNIKRGVAAGVADISRILSRKALSGEPHQFLIKLFGSTYSGATADEYGNNGWGEVIDRIISGSPHGLVVNPQAEKLVVTVKEFKHQFRGDEYSAQTSAPIHRIRPIFFDPMAENYERIYLTIRRIRVVGCSGDANLYTLEVSAPQNDLILFSKASNQQPSPTWLCVTVKAGEAVGEKIKIDGITLSKDLPEDHIVLNLYTNGQLLAQGSFPFKLDAELIEFNGDTASEVQLYSLMDSKSFASVEITTDYIGKLFNALPAIDTIIHATDFMHDEADKVQAALLEMCHWDVGELKKHFAELLSSLFEILECVDEPRLVLDHLKVPAIKAVVYLLDGVIGKLPELFYLLDLFLRLNTISYTVGLSMLKEMSRIFATTDDDWNEELEATCRIFTLLLNLASLAVNADKLDTALAEVFKSAKTFLAIDSPDLIDEQILVLGSIDFVFNYETIMTKPQLLRLTILLVESIGSLGCGRTDHQHRIAIAKQLLISRLFSVQFDPDCEFELAMASIKWSIATIRGPIDIDVARLSCATICLIFSIVKEKHPARVGHVIRYLPEIASALDSYYKYTRAGNFFAAKTKFTHLFPVEYPFVKYPIDPVVGEEAVIEVLIELAATFCYLSRIGSEWAESIGISTLVTRDCRSERSPAHRLGVDEIVSVIDAIKCIRQGKFFPEGKWLSLYVCFIEGCISALEVVGPFIIADHVPTQAQKSRFDRRIWGKYLKTLLKVASLPPIATEHLLDVPREASFRIAGDLRRRAVVLIAGAWDALADEASSVDLLRYGLTKFGGYQASFVASEYCVIEDVLLCALQNHRQCQQVGVKLLWSMLVAEFLANNNIANIERESLMGLHSIFARNLYKPHPAQMDSLVKYMRAAILSHESDPVLPLAHAYVTTLSQFFNCLSNNSRIPRGPEFEDDRTISHLEVSRFLMKADKPSLFHSFVHLKAQEAYDRKHYVQAALFKDLLASTLSWDHTTILAPNFLPKFPRQTAFERKEMLLVEIAQTFVEGMDYECAIRARTQLLDAYNSVSADLLQIGHAHQQLADMYLKWQKTEAVQATYYRVMFLGTGFPEYVRGGQLIYEGSPFESIVSIHERMLALHPGARIISEELEAAKLESSIHQMGRYLYISMVEPANEGGRRRELKAFKRTRKLPGSTSIYDLWTEESILETESTFPVLLNRSPVVKVRSVKLSPMQTACKVLESKTQNLRTIKAAIDGARAENADYSVHFDDLSRQLAGTVESPVNGGISQYRKFLTYDSDGCVILKKAFSDLALVLDACLGLHAELVPPSMVAKHQHMEEMFNQNFHQEMTGLGRTTRSLDMLPLVESATKPSDRELVSTHAVQGSLNGIFLSPGSVTSTASSLSGGAPLFESDRYSRTSRSGLFRSSIRSALGSSGKKRK